MAYLVGELIYMPCQTREARAQAKRLVSITLHRRRDPKNSHEHPQKRTLAMAYLVGELIHMPYQTIEAKAPAQGLI